METVLAARPPPTMGGWSPRLYYVTQAEVARLAAAYSEPAVAWSVILELIQDRVLS